ncbi:hypothetical protein ACFL02_05265 [Planctomycetota bacterium]
MKLLHTENKIPYIIWLGPILSFLAGLGYDSAQTLSDVRQKLAEPNDIPIVYVPYLSPLPLAEEQMREILENTRQVKPKKQIWFILVLEHYLYEGKHNYGVTVYFVPDQQTPRIRQGLCMNTGKSNLFTEEERAELLELWEEVQKILGKDPNAINPKEKLHPYIQISDSKHHFCDDLQPPPIRLLPFDVPEGFSLEEIIEIVDFTRSGPRLAVTQKPNSYRLIQQLDSSLPIHRIEWLTEDSLFYNDVKDKKDLIRVWTGFQVAPLAGRGQYFNCRKINDIWRRVGGIVSWVS